MAFKIGSLLIKNKICLAPMAGVSNSAFRRLVKEMGCGLVFAEMVSVKAVLNDNSKTKRMLFFTEEERPFAQQIFGSDKESFVQAAKKVYALIKPDIIDLNMGCPVSKVALRAQAGAFLMKNPFKIYEIVQGVVEAVPCPVTVKIRSGWDNNSINAVEIAKLCEKAGAKAITIHPRTKKQGYSGLADWSLIKQVKENVQIPVIGNGDIKTGLDAKRMLEETNCDAIMIGRGLLGNPWLIKEILFYQENEILLKKPSFKEKIEMCQRHFLYLLEIKTEKEAVLEMRSHTSWYLKGFPQAKKLKLEVFRIKTKEEMLDFFDKCLQ